MKSSNDNTLLLAGLFVLIVVIIALIVYYTRPGETKTPDQTSDTTKLKIENLSFERTLNPDPSADAGDGVSGYTIEPYGIEYNTDKVNYKELSQNVTFTMNWTNAPGFNTVVKGFKIEHFVKPDTEGAASVKKQDLIKKPIELNDQSNVLKETIKIVDFGVSSAKIVSVGTGDNAYSVVGQNSFKLYAVVQKEKNQTFDWDNTSTQDLVELYDGTEETPEPAALKISKNQLSATLSMTEPETLKYTPAPPEDTSTKSIIDKTTYDVTNNKASLNIDGVGVYLTTIAGAAAAGNQFYVTYEDGTFLRDDLTKGPVTTTNGRTKFKFEIVDRPTTCVDDQGNAIKDCDVNKGKIRQVSTETDESKKKYLSSDGSTLKLYTQIQSDLTQTSFDGFKWTFNKRISKMLFKTGGTALGTTVCISGDDAFIGDPEYKSGNKSNSGRVTYYKRSKIGVWEFKKQITSPTPTTNIYFGCSISASGDYVVIGEKGNGSSQGAVRVFMRSADGLFSNDSSNAFLKGGDTTGDRGGESVVIKGNTIIVGVPGKINKKPVSNSDKFPNTGAIRMYTRNTAGTLGKNSWSNGFDTSKFFYGDNIKASGFGTSVDLSEDGQYIIVGAPYTNKLIGEGQVVNNTGAVHIYKNDKAFKDEEYVDKTSFADTGVAESKFGSLVSISSKSGMGYDAVVASSTLVFAYKKVSSSWVKARASGISSGGVPGAGGMSNIITNNLKVDSLSISGDTFVIGHSTKDENTGEVVVVKKGSDGSGPFWKKAQSMSAPTKEKGSKFGKSVRTDGDYIVIGEPSRKKSAVASDGGGAGTTVKGGFYITNV